MKSTITIADVAREAGVSTQTVSRALNNKGEISPVTRERVLSVVERLGYRPNSIARGLVTNRTLTLGLVVPDIANPFFPEIARGVEQVAHDHGYNVFLCHTTEDPAREAAVLRLLEDKRVDGVILCGSRLPDDQLLPLLGRYPAAVLVNRQVPRELAATVRVDDAAGAQLAVQHLWASKRDTIAFLCGPPGSYSGQARVRGFTEALRAVGRIPHPQLIRSCAPDFGGGYQAAHALLTTQPQLNGLFCYNDLVAIGAIKACAELGRRVPEDVAVVGCDDILLADLVTPPLTTLRVSKTAIGSQAARLLLDRLAGQTEQPEILLTPELVVRSSAP